MVYSVQKPKEQDAVASPDQAPTQKLILSNGQQQKPVFAVAKSVQKECVKESCSSMLAQMMKDEEAQPGPGVSAKERQVWGEVFVSRQSFVDMHCC